MSFSNHRKNVPEAAHRNRSRRYSKGYSRSHIQHIVTSPRTAAFPRAPALTPPRATPVAPSPNLLPSRSRHFREWGAKLPLNKSGARPPSTAVNLSARVSFLRVLVSLRLTLAVQIYEVCLFVPRMRARARALTATCLRPHNSLAASCVHALTGRAYIWIAIYVYPRLSNAYRRRARHNVLILTRTTHHTLSSLRILRHLSTRAHKPFPASSHPTSIPRATNPVEILSIITSRVGRTNRSIST